MIDHLNISFYDSPIVPSSVATAKPAAAAAILPLELGWKEKNLYTKGIQTCTR